MPVLIHCITVDLSQERTLSSDSNPVSREEAKKIFERDLVRNTFHRCPCTIASHTISPSLLASRSGSESESESESSPCTQRPCQSIIRKLSKRALCKNTRDSIRSQPDQTTITIQYILKFIKINDQYIVFTSILLKSFLYHSTSKSAIHRNDGTNNDCDSYYESLIVGSKSKSNKSKLPRTKYGKPYIPSKPQDLQKKMIIQNDQQKEMESFIPFSLSHQYPFVGLAYLDMNDIINEPNHSLIVGFDIVTFDAYAQTKSLYSSCDEFLECFRSSFTVWEWSRITKNKNKNSLPVADEEINDDSRHGDPPKVKEMLLRWAMKESYTKGLGTGLGTDFGSFSIKLHDVDVDNNEPTSASRSIFNHICNSGEKVRLSASIYHQQEQDVTDWTFTFIPLIEASDASIGEESARLISGCACICTGPTDPFGLMSDLNLLSMTMQDLIEYHTNIPHDMDV